MKIGDKVKIKRPGILNDLIGTISSVKYNVDLKEYGAFSLPGEELILIDKETTTQSVKIAPNAESESGINTKKPEKIKKASKPIENKPKRKYTKRAKS